MDALDELEGGPASQDAYGDEAQDPNVAAQYGGQDSGHQQLDQTQPLDPLTAVQQQKQQYVDWFKQYITSQAGLDSNAITAGTLAALKPYAALQVSQLVTSLYKANASQSYLSGLKYWAEAVRELERKQRDVQELASLSDATFDLQTYTTAMQAAIQALAAAIYASGYPTYYASSVADVPALAQATSTIDARMHHCRYEVYSRLSSDATSLLEACHWPPPLVQPKKQPPHAQPNGYAGLSEEPHENGLPDGMHSSQGHAEPFQPDEGPNQPAQTFGGFESDGVRLSRLLAVLSCLTSLQLVVERAAFEQAAGGDGTNAGEPPHKETPVLWAASCLAAPLQGRLQLHFQPDKHAGRLDQPAWIFQLVMRLVQEYAGSMAVLQPVLEASGLSGRCHMVVEWARAMRDATKAVLRTARLPALVERWEGQQDEQAYKLWAAQVDAILEFEKQLAPYLGAPAALQGLVALLPDGLLPGSVLGAITEDEGFLDTWVEVLRHHAITRLEEAVEDDAQAWKVGAHLLPDSNGHAPGSGPPPPAPPGSSREFNPPQLAELVSDSITSLVQLAAQTPTPDIQRSLLDRVGAPLLSRTRELLRKSFDEAAQYQGLTSHAGAPYAGACVAAARYLHHVVSELLAGPMLHRLHVAGHGSGPQATGGSPGISPGGQPGAAEISPSKGPLGDVVVRHSFTPVAWDPPVLSAAVNQLGALHREMCLRVAQELSGLFGRGAAEYRAVVDAAIQYPTHTGAAGTVTPLLLPALTALQAGLAALNEPLDGPSFRDIWRAVAVPVNRYMFNYIATEARFTAAGAEQFEVDCCGVVACFAPYTKRPNAHFREMLAAAKLLTLSEEDASDVVRRATTAPVKGIPLYKEPRLAQLGVACLLPAHVVAVVDRRL